MRKNLNIKNLFGSLVFLFVFTQLHFDSLAQTDLPILQLNKITEETIETGKSKSYQIRLEKNKYARLISEQININSFVIIYDPDGVKIAQVQNFIEKGKDNRILLVTEKTGIYRIEIVPIGKKKQQGKFKLILKELRDSTNQDQFLKKAQQSLLTAEKLHTQRNAESRKQAVLKYEEAFVYWDKSGDLLGQADTLTYLGSLLVSTGNFPKALEKLKRARILYNKVGNQIAEAIALRGIGLIHHIRGELDKALESYEQGLTINRKLKNYYSEANDLGNIGGVHQYLGEYEKAIEYYKKALALNQKFPTFNNEARLLNNIGETYRLLREDQKSLDYFNRALKLRRKDQNKRGEGNTLNNIALIYTSAKNYSKAMEFFDKSLKIRREAGNLQGELTALVNIGFTYFKMGNLDRALKNLTQSLELKEKSPNRRIEAATLYIFGRVYQTQNKLEKALDYLRRGLKLSRETKYRETEAAILKSIADIELERGNLEISNKRIVESVKIIESIRSNLSIQGLRTTWLSSHREIYLSNIDVLMKQNKALPSGGFNIKAFHVSEKIRARSLVDLLTESHVQISNGVDLDLLKRLKLIQFQLNRFENKRTRLIGRKGAERDLISLENSITNLISKYEQIKGQIRTKTPRYSELVEPEILDIVGIQRLLDKDTVLLEYSLGKKQSYVWLITNDSVKSFELANEKDITRASRRLHKLMTIQNNFKDISNRNQKGDVQKAAVELSKMVIQPFASDLNKKRIAVVADGALQYIPFAALSSSSSSKQKYQPLVLKHEVINLPSASTLAALRKRKITRKVLGSVAVIADPVFSESDSRVAQSIAQLKNKPQTHNVNLNDTMLGKLNRSAKDLGINGFRRLRFSRREANDIASFASKRNTFKAVDFAADRDLLLKRDLSKYQILHFATHGLLNNKNPELSGLVLSLVDERGKQKDGFLRLHDIYNMKIGADLVVLSACQTALGKDIKGEGLIGLTRGFMYAGANSVVASLWKVEDRATAELMKKFYRAMLKDGQKPAAALRTAQIEMIREKQWNNPYYWAAFTFQGEWN